MRCYLEKSWSGVKKKGPPPPRDEGGRGKQDSGLLLTENVFSASLEEGFSRI